MRWRPPYLLPPRRREGNVKGGRILLVPGLAEHNQVDGVLPWFETGYRFVKRQSQKDPNVWVSLGDPRPAPATVARQRR